MTDAKVTMEVGATVASLIAIRRGQHRFPLCVTVREITDCRPDFTRADVMEVLKGFESLGGGKVRPTVNDEAYFPNEDYERRNI